MHFSELYPRFSFGFHKEFANDDAMAPAKKEPEQFAVFKNRCVEDKGVFFRDGKRRIDFVLAFQITLGLTEESRNAERIRKAFCDSLLREDLHLEIELCNDASGEETQVGFVKIHATWAALSKYAEVLHTRMPIEYFGETAQSAALAASFGEKPRSCFHCLDYDHEAIPDAVDYFSAPFSRPYSSIFRITDPQTFFSDSQRSRIVWRILSDAPYGQLHHEFGIQRLLSKSVYTAAYPLHDGETTMYRPKQIYTGVDSIKAAPQLPNNRLLLYQNWASFSQLFKFQPLEAIRSYYGEKIGIYFAWLGDYTKFLFYLALIGFAVSIYGAVTAANDQTVQQVCSSDQLGCVIMCPLCDEGCGYWILRNSCVNTILTYLCDNASTIAYAVAITIWGTVFIEQWKRRELILKYEWDLHDLQLREPNRPEFEAKASRMRIDPLTNQPEPYEPLCLRLLRGMLSWTVILVLTIAVFGTLVTLIIYRTALNTALYVRTMNNNQNASSAFLQNNGRLLVSLSAAIVNLFVILILSVFYEWVAYKLTEWERPRTQSYFDDSFTIKMFIFQFANCYGTIFYTAFFRGRFQSIHSRISLNPTLHKVVDQVSEECDPAGCMADLTIQLATVMIGRQLVGLFLEIALPLILKRRYQLRGLFSHKKRRHHQHATVEPSMTSAAVNGSSRRNNNDNNTTSRATRWEVDYNLVDFTQSGVLNEYLEMVIQFGFITLFGVCFPLSPVFAFLCNVIEIRLDAYKLTTTYRRPVAAMTDGIGIWLDILRGLLWMSIVCNALIIAFTSENVHRLAFQWNFASSASSDDILLQSPTAINVTADRYRPTFFSMSMSVLETNQTAVHFVPDNQCVNAAAYADPAALGGFEIQPIFQLRNGTVPYCYYRGLYEPPWAQKPYDFKSMHWELLVFRLAFALSFIIVVWLLAWVLSLAIPDRPEKVRQLQRYEHRLHEKALLRTNNNSNDNDNNDNDNDNDVNAKKNVKKMIV